MLRSHHHRSTKRSKAVQQLTRDEAVFNTKSYRDGLQRAFNKAKQQIFFNPDMTKFITLTYKGTDHTPEQVLHDVKMLIKRESRSDRAKRGRLKYIYIMEYQKRGSIHVHMIANNLFTLQVNKNGYDELVHWPQGFSSVLDISGADDNFKPYLYLFKYMKKSQRIGRSFVHSSRNLDKSYQKLEESSDPSLELMHWRTITQEYTSTTVNTTNFSYFKNYLQFDDTIATSLNERYTRQWLDKVKLHSTKALEKLAESRSRP